MCCVMVKRFLIRADLGTREPHPLGRDMDAHRVTLVERGLAMRGDDGPRVPTDIHGVPDVRSHVDTVGDPTVQCIRTTGLPPAELERLGANVCARRAVRMS